jgi:predicted RNA binding protein YcfA (HicA-like mRNA interferase family)
MKPMAKRLVIRALTAQGCLKLSDEGKHEKWGCPEKCGQHTTAVPRHAEITAGVLRGIITDLKCLPKGWLQGQLRRRQAG